MAAKKKDRRSVRRPRISGDDIAGPAPIQRARVSIGWSLDRLADQCGLTERTIRFWETGEVMPHLDHIAMLAEALGVGVGWLSEAHWNWIKEGNRIVQEREANK